MQGKAVYKQTAAVLVAVYILITALVSAGLLVSRQNNAENEIRFRISQVNMEIQHAIYSDPEKSVEENLKNEFNSPSLPVSLNAMLSYGGVEAAVFDNEYNLLGSTTGDWITYINEPDKDNSGLYNMKYVSFSPNEYLSESDIKKIRKLFFYNSYAHGTNVGDLCDYTLHINGWVTGNTIVPYAMRSTKSIIDKNTNNGASISMHEENNDFYKVESSEPDSFEQKTGAIINTGISMVFSPYGRRGVRSDKKQNELREFVCDSMNVRSVIEAQENGTVSEVYNNKGKYKYSVNSYAGDNKAYHLACAYSFNVFAESIGLLIFLWFGSLVIFSAAAAILIKGIRSNIKKSRELEERRRYLTNSLAHDLKAPLAVISGYAQNIKEGIKPQKHGEYTEKIQERAEYMGDIISEMLDMTRLDNASVELDKSEISLKSAAEEVSSAYSELITNKKIQISIFGDATIQADKKLISKVIDNFLVNALKYTPENGKIHIEISPEQFTVYNSGSSVPEGMEDKIWDAYIKADTSRQADRGNGLGLYISASILRQHNFKYGACNADNGFKIWFTFM